MKILEVSCERKGIMCIFAPRNMSNWNNMESIRKKNEWIKQADEEFKRISEERRQLAL